MITKKTIEKWNTYFNSLTPADKRVAIAKDVLEQIKLKRLSALSGTYFTLSSDLDGDKSIQANLNKVECQACALGSMMFSHIKYNNECSIGEGFNLDSRYIKGKLHNYFDEGQLVLIETAFEQWGTNYNYDGDAEDYYVCDGAYSGDFLTDLGLNKDDLDRAGEYFDEDSFTDEEKLVKIMKNIVKNKGTFVV
jgi:hypothetical protein